MQGSSDPNVELLDAAAFVSHLVVLSRQVGVSRLMGGWPPRAWCRRWWL